MVPIFPLPETVLFPLVEVSLHLFEPRYRQMGEDVIAGDGYLVMALLESGWQEDYEGDPPVHEIATLGRVIEHDRLDDGRYDIVLRGERRVRLEPPVDGNEHPNARLYRMRPFEPAPESSEASAEAAVLRDRLGRLWSELLRHRGGRGPSLPPEPLSFPEQVNRIASGADIPADAMQSLLEEDSLETRGQKLATLLEERLLFWRQLTSYRRTKPDDPSRN